MTNLNKYLDFLQYFQFYMVMTITQMVMTTIQIFMTIIQMVMTIIQMVMTIIQVVMTIIMNQARDKHDGDNSTRNANLRFLCSLCKGA